MKNKWFRKLWILLCILIMLFFGVYLALVVYYKQNFTVNTWINDVYCTGKSPEEVNAELLQNAEAPYITIKAVDGKIYEIDPVNISMSMDYTNSLNQVLQQQNPLLWPRVILNNTFSAEKNVIDPDISFNSEMLREELMHLPFVKGEEIQPKNLQIVNSEEDGYILYNGLQDRLNMDLLYLNVLERLLTKEYFIDVKDISCYVDLPLNNSDDEVIKQWNTLEEYINCGIVYDMGFEQIPLAGKIASSFILTDKLGQICFDQESQPVIDEKKIEAFVNSLSDAYNTYGKELKFTSTSGEEKIIPYKNYGTEIDSKSEIEYLKRAFREKADEIHIPEYIHKGYVRGLNDIGDTYIEVDMGKQKLYAYLDGELFLETDIVTGNERRKMSTPEGVVYVYKKQRNRTLRGPGYASFVKYWMPVKGGIGLHDASWRKEFGDDIYKTDGSHGCINIPKDVMPDIYENFEVGTPVIMFY